MRAGKLRHTIVIERAVTTFDAARTPIELWTEIATLRAELVDLRDTETPREPGASTDAVLTFRTRYHSAIATKDRLRFRQDVHEIVEVRELGRRRDLEIRCVTRRT